MQCPEPWNAVKQAQQLINYYQKEEAISHAEWALNNCVKESTKQFWREVLIELNKPL